MVGDSPIQKGGDMPLAVDTRSQDPSVHRPVMVLAKGNPVGRLVIVTLAPRNKMSSVHELYIPNNEPKPTRSASVVVEVQDELSEGNVAGLACFTFIFLVLGQKPTLTKSSDIM